MYSCDHERTAPPTHTAFGASMYQPRIGVVSGHPEQYHHAVGTKLQPAAGQAPAVGSAAAHPHPRPAAKKRHAASTSTSRPSTTSGRSSTTVVATDVSNFRAMVQELTGFPPAAIFRPLPRRVPVYAAPNPLAAVQHGCGGGGGAVHGQGSDTSAAAGSGSSPALQLPQCSPAVGVFDGLPDLGSPEFDSWLDLN